MVQQAVLVCSVWATSGSLYAHVSLLACVSDMRPTLAGHLNLLRRMKSLMRLMA